MISQHPFGEVVEEIGRSRRHWWRFEVSLWTQVCCAPVQISDERGYTQSDVRCEGYCGMRRTLVLIAGEIDQRFATGLRLLRASMAVGEKASRLINDLADDPEHVAIPTILFAT